MRRKLSDPENGLVIKRGIYWFSREVKGVRKWHNLRTPDLYKAIEQKAIILQRPDLIAEEDSIERAIDRFLKYKVEKEEYRPISATNSRSGLRRFVAFMGEGATLASIQTHHVQKWYDSEYERGMPSTAERYLICVQALFRWAIEVERIRHDNPAKGVSVTPPNLEPRVQRFATKEQRDQLIAKAPNDDMRFVLYCGFHAGLRMTEISEARVFWFDLHQKLLHVQATPLARGVKGRHREVVKDIYGMHVRLFRTKGGNDRTIPLTESFHAFLSTYLDGRNPGDFIGQPERTAPIGFYRWKFKHAFTKYVGATHKWLSPHVMRHTFASLLVIKGVSLYKVAKWLGDTLATAEKHYAHLAPLDADIQHLE